MKVISFAAQKGGCGKSSLAISSAVLAARNKRVLLIDADPQSTALQWRAGRNGDPPEVRRFQAGLVAKDEFDFVFIDTPGHIEGNLSGALKLSTFVLVPTRPTLADARAMPPIAKMLTALKRPFAFVLTQVQGRGTRADETAAALAALGDVAPVRTVQRVVWQDAYAASLGVSEYEPSGAATRELNALWQWLNARLQRIGS
jgi:chromosome partitioning protein